MVDDDPREPRARSAPGAPTLAAEPLAPTQLGGVTASDDTVVPNVGDVASLVALPAPGYQVGELIGRGGMGEVMAAHDQRIGREVAIKRMRSATPDGEQLARFLREARIQARLDHPAIVPVYELGNDASGRPYFTMKRVSGRTLAERLKDGATTQALLRAFVDVCLAVDRAHSRGVVHRDLKPSNIMLGDYGEVYVLDWGIARVLADKDTQTSADIDTLDEGTQTGALLGTPGYMAPEQVKGERAMAAADVYALGSILFEILAGESLHPRGSAAITSTLTSPQDAPARRRSDGSVSPELDAACHAALAEEPAVRPTARELGDRVQAYLDGDRDLERRRRLAAEQLAGAREALVQGGAKARPTAIQRAGRALALDPESAEAAELVTSLIVEPPAELPAELVAELAEADLASGRQRSRAGLYAYLGLFAFWLWMPFVGVKSWAWLVVLFVVIGVLTLTTWRSAQTGRYNAALGLLLNLGLVIAWTRLAGIFLLTPILLCAVLLAVTTTQWLMERRWIVVAWTIAAFTIPAGLEYVGWLPASWEVTYDAIISHSTIFAMSGFVADASLFLANIVFVSMVGLVGVNIHQAAKRAKRSLYIQAWHLNHLLPQGPRPQGDAPAIMKA